MKLHFPASGGEIYKLTLHIHLPEALDILLYSPASGGEIYKLMHHFPASREI
jgi:hypothetical protein